MDNVFFDNGGDWAIYLVSYLQSRQGGEVPKDVAIKAAQRAKKWWSQDEGLALVLFYDRLKANPDWKILFN